MWIVAVEGSRKMKPCGLRGGLRGLELSAGAFFPPDFPVRVRHAGFSLGELRCRVHGEGFKLGIRSLRLTFRDAAVRLLGTSSKGRSVSCPIQSGRQVQSIPLTNPCENSPRRLRLKA
jgi:hypothetical protein